MIVVRLTSTHVSNDGCVRDHDDPGVDQKGMGFGEAVQASLKQDRWVCLDQIVEPHSVYPVHYVVTAATPETDQFQLGLKPRGGTRQPWSRSGTASECLS